MLKFISSKFNLDLSNKKVTENEQSNFFLDRYFTKFTFPFEFEVTPEIDEALGMISSNNSLDFDSVVEGFYLHFGKMEKAILEIETVIGKKATANISYGIEELENAEKKLSQLPLDNFSLQNSIYDYAESILDQVWPAVSHNFPAIRYDGLENGDEQWWWFEQYINKRLGGQFIKNSYDAQEDVQLNKNIMQPIPFLMHVLQVGFSEIGFEMDGTLLQDPDFTSAVIVHLSDYYTQNNSDKQEIQINSSEFYETWWYHNVYGKFQKQISFNDAGRYKIAGNLHLRTKFSQGIGLGSGRADGVFSYQGEVMSEHEQVSFQDYSETVKNIDFNIDWHPGDGPVIFESHNLKYSQLGEELDHESIILDLTVTQIAKYDDNGVLQSTLIEADSIRLEKCVPDMTFGELITAVRKWRNLEVKPIGQTIFLNHIEQAVQASEIIDISEFDPPEPVRELNRKETYILKFEEIESEEYNFEKIHITKNGYSTVSESPDNEANEIIINGVPLPVVSKIEISRSISSPYDEIYSSPRSTAHFFPEAEGKLCLAVYRGLIDGENNCSPSTGLELLNTFLNFYKNWIQSVLINGMVYKWTIVCFEKFLININVHNRLKAYNRLHIPKSFTKTNESRDIWVVEIETVSSLE